MACVVSKESFTPPSGYLIQAEMGTVINREDFSVEVDSVDPLDPDVVEFRLVIGWSIAMQSFIKRSVNKMRLRLDQVEELVYILRLNCQNAL